MSTDAARQHPPAAPPVAPRGDSTRTIATIALVLSVLALVVPVGMFAGPLLLFGGLGVESSSELLGPESVTSPGSQGSAFDLTVGVRDGRADGRELERTLRDGVVDGAAVSCPGTVDAGVGDVVTCTAGADAETYVVVRFVDARGALTADWFTPDHSFRPGS